MQYGNASGGIAAHKIKLYFPRIIIGLNDDSYAIHIWLNTWIYCEYPFMFTSKMLSIVRIFWVQILIYIWGFGSVNKIHMIKLLGVEFLYSAQ